MTNESKIYIENLNTMRDVVSKIKNMQDPDVDQLVPLTERGLEARKQCLSRIESVEKALGINSETTGNA
jgi:hypothetical protein